MIQIEGNHQLLFPLDDYECAHVKFFSDFGTFSDELNGYLWKEI